MIPLLSILIATKNRQKYCLSAVESILMLSDDNIEVIVQDNSDDTNLENLISPYLQDNRLTYRYTPPPFSSIDNFNAALELASGEYVCLIGDDDGINPEIVKATQWAKDNHVDCLVGSVNVLYRWEGTGAPDTLFTKMKGSTLTITHFDGKAKRVNIEKSYENFKRNGCTNYLEFSFPKFYHGIVRKALFDEIRAQTGAYIKGLSPDIYSAMALSLKAKNIIEIDYPLTMPGVCGQSTSITEGQLKKHSKKLEDAPHFRDRKEPYQWTQEVPKIYCVQTIWADSGFAAMREFGQEHIFDGFDRYMLCANILDADPSLEEMVYDYLKKTYPDVSIVKHKKNLKIAKLTGPLPKFIKNRALGRLKKMLKLESFVIIDNVPDMVAATKTLTGYLSQCKIDFINELEKI